MRPRALAVCTASAILAIICGCSSNSASNSANSASGSAPQPASAQPAQPTPPPPPPVVVPSGTTLTVTIDQAVSTKTGATGDRFDASLAEPVTVDSNTVIARGARISGTVTASDRAGHLKGGSELAVTLNGITVSGQRYSMETSTYAITGKGRGKRTVAGGGGGAAVGAIIGALAGGGKGAAIGAVAGGGAGTAGAAYTGNRDLTIPAETRVHFKLLKPLNISQGQ